MLAGVVAVLLVPLTALSLAGAWARAIVVDTERYVATVAPLVEEPAIQQAMAAQVSDQVVGFARDWVDDLPDLLQQPAEQLLDSLGALVVQQVTTVVSSEQFAAAWEEANRTAHAEVMASLTGRSGGLVVDGRTVSIRSQALVDAARAGLAGSGFDAVGDLLPDVTGSFVVLESDALPAVRAALRLLDAVGGWLWLVAGLLVVAVVLAAPRRLVGAGLAAAAVTAGAGLLLGLLALLRTAYVASTPGLSMPAKTVLFDQLTAALSTSTSVVVVCGLVVVGVVGAVLVLRRRDVEPTRADLRP